MGGASPGGPSRLVTDWAFASLELSVILLEINEQNPASMAVARSAGYHEAGRLDVNTETGVRGNLIFSRLVADTPPGVRSPFTQPSFRRNPLEIGTGQSPPGDDAHAL